MLEIGKHSLRDVDFVAVRLRERNYIDGISRGQKPAYVALSHAWGGAQPFRLMTENKPLLIRAIRIDDLPRTYRDAIIVTAMLGYSWIWIDSMCIIQDSQKDWEAEALLMGTVYSNCALNLAALDAPNCHQGLF